MDFVKRIIRKDLPFLFACPALIWQAFFLYLPLMALLAYSLRDYTRPAKYFNFSLVYYFNVLNSLYLRVILNSFSLALLTSCICLFIAYPVAYFLAIKVKKFKTFLLFSLILPSWTSFIVQVYAWIFLLQKKGPLVSFFYSIGLISESTHLLNNYFAIQVGMVYCFLPFMILPIYTVLEKMDKRLLEASADLGANGFQTFKKVILPLSFPGVIVGFFLVFIPAFGEFAVPDLLGGGKKVFWGSIIVEKFLLFRDWQSGSALTFVGIIFLIFIFFLTYILYRFFKRFIRTRKIWSV